jgi:phosphoribosylanthranilate isomerase
VSLRIKVCGVTREADAALAAELGVDAVGFNFAPGSPRRLEPDRARALGAVLPPFVVRVGVFVDADRKEIEAVAGRAGLHVAQLHGEETPEMCAALRLPWYKAHRVGEGFRADSVRKWGGGAFLLDAAAPDRRGGTGRTFDWAVAREAAAHGRVILAGGLTPENVAAAIAAARPYAVDVSSGVESAPGVKDPGRLRAFVRRAREAAARLAGEEGGPA